MSSCLAVALILRLCRAITIKKIAVPILEGHGDADGQLMLARLASV
jgi:hypothetical protein